MKIALSVAVFPQIFNAYNSSNACIANGCLFNLLGKLPLKVTADKSAALHDVCPQVIFKDRLLMKNTSLIFKE